MLWMKQAGMSDAGVLRALMIASWIAVVAVVALQVMLAAKIAGRATPGRSALSWRAARGDLAGAFFFMPITLAYSLGQAQIFLDLFFTLLVLFWIEGRERPAGVMMALLAMVKPQFGLLLLWAALRRRWNALGAGMAALGVGGAVSLAVFGVRNNLDYLGVLAGLSRKAQSHYANQSIFGLLNRAIFNGENLPYHPYVYPPYVPWIYAVTLATTAALVLLALAYRWRERAGGHGGPGGHRGGLGDCDADGMGAPLRRDAAHLRVALVRGLPPGLGGVWALALALVLDRGLPFAAQLPGGDSGGECVAKLHVLRRSAAAGVAAKDARASSRWPAPSRMAEDGVAPVQFRYCPRQATRADSLNRRVCTERPLF